MILMDILFVIVVCGFIIFVSFVMSMEVIHDIFSVLNVAIIKWPPTYTLYL